MKIEKSYDHMFAEFLKAQANFRRSVGSMIGAHRRARGNAFDMARWMLEIQRDHHNQLLTFVPAGRTVDDWLDEQFDGIESIGESRPLLFKFVAEGGKRNEYRRKGTTAYFAKMREKRSVVQKELENKIDEVVANLPPEEENKIIRAELASERRMGLERNREIALCHERIQFLENQLARTERKLAAVMRDLKLSEVA